MSADTPLVFVPDRFGLSIVDVHQLVGYLDNGDDLDTAVANAAIDTVDLSPEQVERVRSFNTTGDIDALWDLS